MKFRTSHVQGVKSFWMKMENSNSETARGPSGPRWIGLTLAVAVLLALSFGGYRLWVHSGKQIFAVPSSTAESVTVPVEGMSCSACVARVKKTLKGIEGVLEAQVSLEKREAEVRYEPGKTAPEKLARSIDELGYKAGTPKRKVNSP